MDLSTIKARQKATWESGDFGEVAKFGVPVAEDFMSRIPLRPGARVLDVACGTGNLAMVAAQRGCVTEGIDLAANLIQQARLRAALAKLSIVYRQGDAEELPYNDGAFDIVVSMFGTMFAPRPERVAAELIRVTKPGGLIALANWTPDGFIGEMFRVFQRHLPPGPPLPSPMEWGQEPVVRSRFDGAVSSLHLTRRLAHLRYPFSPAQTVEFFRQYYGPTKRAFATLSPEVQAALRADLERLQSDHNRSADPNATETQAEYLEVHALRCNPIS